MTLAWALTALAALSGALHVRAEYRGPRTRVYVFKPLTIVCVLALALTVAEPVSAPYRLAIAAGLVCSLAGDVFLMLPGDRFLPGVASFLLAHLAYLAAFTRDAAFGAFRLLLVPYALVGAVMLLLLWRRLGAMRLPVLVYLVVIVVMAWQAASRAVQLGSNGALLAAAGAALFVASDASLALNRFRRPFRAAQALILTTYYAAQLLIAWSVSAPGH
jgi:uncharacterized membrane protein YhhN